MRGWCSRLIGLLLPVACAAGAQAQPSPIIQAHYQTFAAGLHVADVDAGFNLNRGGYRMNLAYHTTGVMGFFFRGHQFSSVIGNWLGNRPSPVRFRADGVWRGRQRITDIDYLNRRPILRQMVPSNDEEREPVPDALQVDSIDTMSALIELIHTVSATGACNLSVRTYDGRRATEIDSQTVGQEVLTPLRESRFNGPALRCDFSGRLLAGFLHDDDRQKDSKPLHGSAWLAQVVPGAPVIPVRMSFETRWFGDATMYLTNAETAQDLMVAGAH